MNVRTGIAAFATACVMMAAHSAAQAGVVAEEHTVIDFLQMFTMDVRQVTHIEGDKARMEQNEDMLTGQPPASEGDSTPTTEIHRFDRGVVYRLIEASRQYREFPLARQAAPPDSSRQLAQIASGLGCRWATPEVVSEPAAARVRIEATHRCVAATSTCTLAVKYEQWDARPDGQQSQLARYHREYAARTGTRSAMDDMFSFFSGFGVPVDPALLDPVRTAVASRGPASKTHAELRASRSCFIKPEGAASASTSAAATLPPEPEQPDPGMLPRYMGGMLLAAWVAETPPGQAGVETAETLGTITTEVSALRAEKLAANQFEVPAGYTKAD